MAGKSALKDHIIVCGYGIVGQRVVDILAEEDVPFIVIEVDKQKAENVRQRGYEAISGDATKEKILKDAGIKSAKAIAIVMDNDAKNLFSVLTAKDLNKEIFIATRANDDAVRQKLIEAGADYIVMPQKAASKEIADEILKS